MNNILKTQYEWSFRNTKYSSFKSHEPIDMWLEKRHNKYKDFTMEDMDSVLDLYEEEQLEATTNE
jgi:hypothetical protein